MVLGKRYIMDSITTKSISNQYAEVPDEIVLEDTPKTRILFKAAMHPGGIRGELIRYRKDSEGRCEEPIPVNFNSLHENEGIKIQLKTDALEKLFISVQQLKDILEKDGIQFGTHKYGIVNEDALIVDDDNKARIIQKLLEADYGEDVWIQLSEANPDIATKLANSKIQENRTSVLAQFEAMLADDTLSESDWQSFFEDNTWIFGYGLKYQILKIIQTQPAYGGTGVNGAGAQRGDFLAATEAETKYTCLVEIKKPTTNLLQAQSYRNGVYGISQELSGAVSQVQVNCAKWEITGSRTDENRESLTGYQTIAPKGLLIVGHTRELDSLAKKNSFERFRQEMRSPEIITYDELYERAKYIVGQPTENHEDSGLIQLV